jgi:predicted XRE-type DNA-binding protein
MELKTWLDQERGRYAALAEFLGISAGRMSQIAVDGVPQRRSVQKSLPSGSVVARGR